MGEVRWDVERMRAVAAEWDAALRAWLPAYARLVPEAEARGSVLRPGATEQQLIAAEQRLGVALPSSYRSFLAVSDGADAGVQGADCVERFYGEHRNALCGVEELRPLSEYVDWLVPQWLETWSKYRRDQRAPTTDTPAQVFDFEPGLKALALTVPQQDGTLALVPFAEEWQVWEFRHSEVIAWVSLAQYLLDQARRAWTGVADREARVRMAIGDGHSLAETTALAEHGDPRAVHAACRLVAERGSGQAIVLLVKLGDPVAIPTLRHAYARTTDHTERTLLVWALQSCGDPWIVDELKRLVAEGNADEMRWASNLFEKHDQIVRW